MRRICFGLLTIILVACTAPKDELIPILPQPKIAEFRGGEIALKGKALALKISTSLSPGDKIVLDEIQEIINKKYQTKSSNADKNVSLQIQLFNNDGKEFKKLIPSEDLERFIAEGYSLDISQNQISISAFNNRGMFYGLQSLKQLLTAYSSEGAIPALKVIDYPHFAFRGLMDDISRGPIPNLEYMKLQVRRIAELKYNYLMYYIEHVIKTESHPEFAPDDALTISEINELSEYAKKYNVTLLGSFQSFGHFEHILKHPKYAHLGERGKLLSPVFDESYKLLNDIYSEMIPAFDAPIFNVNCDETFDLGKGYSKALVDSLGYAEVYKRHILRLYEDVESYGTRMMIWGDVVLKYPEILDDLPKDVVIGMWDYNAEIDVDAMTDPLINRGFDILVIPGVLNSNRLLPDYNMTLANINNVLETKGKPHVLGTLLTVWDDGGFAFFNNDWYGVGFNANMSWSFNRLSNGKFNTIYSKAVLDDPEENYTNALKSIERLINVQPSYIMNDRILRIPSVDIERKIIGISTTGWEEVRRITAETDSFLQVLNPRYRWDYESLDFINSIYQTLAAEKSLLMEFSETSLLDSEELDSVLLRYFELGKELEAIWSFENRPYFLEESQELISKHERYLRELKEDYTGKFTSFVDGGKFFLEWMTTKPITGVTADKFNTDFLMQMGGEAEANPKVTQEFTFGQKLNRWSRIISPIDAVNIFEIGKDAPGVIYLFATIQSGEELQLPYTITTSAKYSLFINGEKFAVEKKALSISPGKNRLLIKLLSNQPEFLFAFAVTGRKCVNSKNRYKIKN